MLGFDTLYDESLSDPDYVRIANEEARTLLTRDRHLLRELRPLRSLEVRHGAPLDQLHQVVVTLQLPAPAKLFTRCMVCNAVLSEPLTAAEAELVVPERVSGIPGPERQCPVCLRVYWHGSHVRRMRAAIERTLPGWLNVDAVGLPPPR